MKYLFSLLFILSIFFSFGQNQQKIDSLKTQLIQANSDKKKGEIENLIAKHLISYRDLEKAIEHINLALNYGIACRSKEIISEAYLNYGNIAYIKAEDSKAITYYQKVDSVLTKENTFNKTLYKAYYNTANLYYIQVYNDTVGIKRVETYLKKAREVAYVLKDSTVIAQITMRIGDIYRSKKEYNKALSQFKEAELLIPKGDQKLTPNVLWAYGGVYLQMGQIEKASTYFDKRFALLKNSENPNKKADAYWVHSNFLMESKQYEKAIPVLKQSLDLYEKFEENKDLPRLAGTASRISDTYEALGDNKKALYYFKKAIEYNDEHRDLAKEDLVEELETKYQTEKKEQEIALLKSEKELNEQKRKSQRNLFIGGIGLTSMAGLFLFFLFKNRQKTNTKLRELDTAKSNFFANISHEFRTPLTLISNPIEQALQDESIPEKKRAQFTMAKQNSERLLSLVNQLLDLSKIDAGQLKLRIQKSNPIQLIAPLSESFNYEAEQNQIDYSVNAIQNNEEVWFDKDALEKITINLVSNALKYTPEEGLVICNTSIDNNLLSLEVKNTGKGLTSDEVKHIFQRFYQTSEDNQGTGIGLALVKELVELHKGTITVESTPNEWTTFTVKLPVDKNSFKNEQFVDTVNIESIDKTIVQHTTNDEEAPFVDNDQPILLIVEDNADVRTLLKQTFEASYNIISATNGEEGIELALEHIPDIIISDIMMPVKDGIELTSQLKNDERTSHIPIVLLTAKAGEDNELKGIETGADNYITKPFSSKLLSTKVAKLIESRQLLQKRYSQELVLIPKDFAVTDLDEQFLEKVQTILDKNLVESSFSVTAFSEAVGMSRMQLHRKLKALTGLSATEFIRSQRLKLAAHLLKSSDINISQVGYSVGFNDHSYFAKCFKEAYNCTPTEYAKLK